MLSNNTMHASPGGLSRWPRILFLGTAACAFAVLFGLWAYGSVDKNVYTTAGGSTALGVLTVAPGLILAWLASPGEANPRRTTGIWIALLSYMGCITALALVFIGNAIWQAGGGSPLDMIASGDPMPAGLVDSPAGTSFGIGLALAWLAGPVCLPAGLYSLAAHWLQPHRGPEALVAADERARRLASGFEAGAAITATLVAALGLAVAALFHYAPGVPMPAWSEGGRVAAFGGILGLAAALVAAGTVLDLRGRRKGLPGRALLWVGAMVLTVAGVLDSFSATSLSGTTGTYAASATGSFNGAMLTHWIGLGSFLLPAGVVALFLAISVTHVHLPLHLHLPRYHRHPPTIGVT